MCFDEATSALDNETEAEVQSAIDNIRTLESKRPTTLIIAHRLSTVQKCDQIIVLKDGKIIERGTHDELLSDADGYYKKLWGFQAKGIGLKKVPDGENENKKEKKGKNKKKNKGVE